MNDLPVNEFLDAISKIHGCLAELGSRVSVESFRDEPVWQGEVLVFDLHNHPTAKTCYAWSVEGRVTAVLHEGPVDSPEAAVRAAVAAEHRFRGGSNER